jgi:hypothetical protein
MRRTVCIEANTIRKSYFRISIKRCAAFWKDILVFDCGESSVRLFEAVFEGRVVAREQQEAIAWMVLLTKVYLQTEG